MGVETDTCQPLEYTIVPIQKNLRYTTSTGENMYAKAVSIDTCGLLVDVCGLMLGVGMTNEQENADAWGMERKTGLTVPSMAIVHIERGGKGTRARSKQEHDGKHGIRWW